MFKNFETIPSEPWRAISNLKKSTWAFSTFQIYHEIFNFQINNNFEFKFFKNLPIPTSKPPPWICFKSSLPKISPEMVTISKKLRGKSVDFVKIFIWKKNFYVDYDILKIWLAWKTSIFWDFFFKIWVSSSISNRISMNLRGVKIQVSKQIHFNQISQSCSFHRLFWIK